MSIPGHGYRYTIGGKTITIIIGPPEPTGGAQLSLGIGGKLWYGIVSNPGAVFSFTPATTTFDAFPSPTGVCNPAGVAENGNGKSMVIGVNCSERFEFLTGTGQYTEFNTPSGQLIDDDLVVGPDKRVWGGYCCNASGSLVAIDATGKLTAYPLPNAGEQVTGVAVGPDKNIWYTTNIGIGKAVPATGKATDYAVGFAADAIASGSDGKIWFGNANAAQIASIEPSGTGLSLYTNGISGVPHFMALGPDKNLYFSEVVPSTGQAALARITAAGVVTEFALPYGFNPGGVSVGPDANIWTVDQTHNQLGQLVLK